MKVTTYTINEGTASQYYGLKSVSENHVLHYAPNNWKTKRGAINWAKKNGYEVEENKDRIPITVPAGDKDRIAAWAKSRGYPSTNAYITDLVYKDMGER